MAATRLLPRSLHDAPSRPTTRSPLPSRSPRVPRPPTQTGFLLWVGIDPDDRSAHVAEIIDLAETLGELARELLPTSETFTALSFASTDGHAAPTADLGALRTRLAELEIIAHVPTEHDGPPQATPDFAVDLQPRVVVDIAGRRVVADGAEQRVTSKEFELLAHLAASAGRVVPRSELLGSVWRGGSLDAASRTIDVHVRRLRDKLRLHDEIITVRGAGYRFEGGGTVTVVRGA